MKSRASDRLAELASRLMVHGGRFSRSLSHRAGAQLSFVAVRALSNLQHQGPLRLGELAASELVSQPAMTATVNKLEHEGLVTRGDDAEDGRVSVIALTPAGDAALERFRARAAAAARRSMEQLSVAELDTLDRAAELLERLVRSIEAR